jgi:quercetin dioxygenase-like cupin family protein
VPGVKHASLYSPLPAMLGSSAAVPLLGGPIIDGRGEIQRILGWVKPKVGSVVRIASRPGSVRANHYHKDDFHFCFVESGKVIYASRPVGSKQSPDVLECAPGTLFFTPPLVEHTMVFPVDTVMWCFAGRERTSEDYERDLVRVRPLLDATGRVP